MKETYIQGEGRVDGQAPTACAKKVVAILILPVIKIFDDRSAWGMVQEAV